MIRTPLEHVFLPVNGLKMHVVQAGPADGPPLVLLHGFPEFWYGWRNQIDPLVEAGFRLYIPDQRGYNCWMPSKSSAAESSPMSGAAVRPGGPSTAHQNASTGSPC